MKQILYLAALALILSSCGVNKDIMFKTPDGYAYDDIPATDSLEYRISPNDRLEFRLFTNDGYKLVDLTGERGSANAQTIRQFGISYLVEMDGMVKLPTLGRVPLAGYTIKDAELMLEELYTEFYRKPFIQLTVLNNRVIVSPGDGGQARVVNITNNNMTVLEVLAQAGGIANRGNSSKVKVIRDMGDHKQVFLLDLSKIETMETGYMIVQADDIIYVEPNPELAREILTDLTPIISLITSGLFLYTLVTRNN